MTLILAWFELFPFYLSIGHADVSFCNLGDLWPASYSTAEFSVAVSFMNVWLMACL